MKRPDGGSQLAGGWIAIFVGVILFFASLLMKVDNFNGVDRGQLAMRSVLSMSAGGLIGIGFVLLAVGWILRGLYFLPGRDEPLGFNDVSNIPVDDGATGEDLASSQADNRLIIVLVAAVVLLIAFLAIAGRQ